MTGQHTQICTGQEESDKVLMALGYGGTELLSRPYDIHILMNIQVCRHGCAHKIHEHKHKYMVHTSHGIITIPFNIKLPMWIHMQAEYTFIHALTNANLGYPPTCTCTTQTYSHTAYTCINPHTDIPQIHKYRIT